MIRISNIKINYKSNQDISIKNKLSKIFKQEINEYKINKRSIDARDKNNILFVYTLDVNIQNEDKYLNDTIKKVGNEEYKFKVTGTKELTNRPVVVGFGPAGIFLSYMLSLYGYKPLIIERGKSIDERVNDVENFFKDNNLNPESNIQFGEGGAGTFSDGKLNTLTKDENFRSKKIFEIFVENGAPEEILYDYKPHIGTDILRTVIKNIRNKILDMGGEIRYSTKLSNINIQDNRVKSIIVNDNEEIACDNLFLCIGHSARDTFYMLNDNKLDMKAKPFAVGIRIVHNREDINKSMFGNADFNILGTASYKLTYKSSNGRGVYSFCMCPGGYVVNASSELNRLAINGMSNYDRMSNSSNSAIVVTVSPTDFGNNIFDGIEYQRKLEEKAYKLGNSYIPVQLYKDYINNISSKEYGSILPEVKGFTQFSNLNELFPEYINESLKEAIPYFGTKIKGYDNPDSVIMGIESRTSSPVTIIRDENHESNIKGIYPVGEGAGYAGGITTAAIDGIKTFEKFASIYKA
jgi:uncharacterized FAD-dependent dehydrogenase